MLTQCDCNQLLSLDQNKYCLMTLSRGPDPRTMLMAVSLLHLISNANNGSCASSSTMPTVTEILSDCSELDRCLQLFFIDARTQSQLQILLIVAQNKNYTYRMINTPIATAFIQVYLDVSAVLRATISLKFADKKSSWISH